MRNIDASSSTTTTTSNNQAMSTTAQPNMADRLLRLNYTFSQLERNSADFLFEWASFYIAVEQYVQFVKTSPSVLPTPASLQRGFMAIFSKIDELDKQYPGEGEIDDCRSNALEYYALFLNGMICDNCDSVADYESFLTQYNKSPFARGDRFATPFSLLMRMQAQGRTAADQRFLTVSSAIINVLLQAYENKDDVSNVYLDEDIERCSQLATALPDNDSLLAIVKGIVATITRENSIQITAKSCYQLTQLLLKLKRDDIINLLIQHCQKNQHVQHLRAILLVVTEHHQGTATFAELFRWANETKIADSTESGLAKAIIDTAKSSTFSSTKDIQQHLFRMGEIIDAYPPVVQARQAELAYHCFSEHNPIGSQKCPFKPDEIAALMQDDECEKGKYTNLFWQPMLEQLVLSDSTTSQKNKIIWLTLAIQHFGPEISVPILTHHLQTADKPSATELLRTVLAQQTNTVADLPKLGRIQFARHGINRQLITLRRILRCFASVEFDPAPLVEFREILLHSNPRSCETDNHYRAACNVVACLLAIRAPNHIRDVATISVFMWKNGEDAANIRAAYTGLTLPAVTAVLPPEQQALMTAIPVPLLALILNSNESLTSVLDKFHQFKQKFDKHNLTTDEFHQREYDSLMAKNAAKIINLYGIMGGDTWIYLTYQMNNSVMSLERFFTAYEMVPPHFYPVLRNLFTQYKTTILKGSSSDWQNLLIQIVARIEIEKQISDDVSDDKSNDQHHVNNENDDDDENTKEKIALTNKVTGPDGLQQACIGATTLAQIANQYAKALIRLYLKKLNINLASIDIDNIVKHFPASTLARLMVGRRMMANSEYLQVFDQIVFHDLSANSCFQQFTNDPEQESELGQRLSQFNRAITRSLNAAEIDVEKAYHYPARIAFHYDGDATLDCNHALRTVWNSLNELGLAISVTQEENQGKENGALIRQIDGLKSKCQKIQKQVLKGKSENSEQTEIDLHRLNKLRNDVFTYQLEQIIALFSRIELDLQKQPQRFRSIIEHGRHLRTHYQHLSESIYTLPTNTSMLREGRLFVVEQWDKNKIETFLLGDYLHCCLAPDGGQFAAMVQRRMDNAMMMHVVIDQTTGEPVCGNWLFFAYDKQHNKNIYVVANFFEIRRSYANNATLRDCLVDHLTYFTGQYAQAINAKGFICAPLTYGSIPNFDGTYDAKQIQIEKVGGYFSPYKYEESEHIQKRYYLSGIEKTQFYLYDEAKCLARQHVTVSELVDPTLLPPPAGGGASAVHEQTALVRQTQRHFIFQPSGNDSGSIDALNNTNNPHQHDSNQDVLENKLST